MAEVGPIEPAAAVSEERLRQAEAYVEAEEGVVNRLSGIAGTVVTSIAVAMTLFHLYAAYDIVPTQPLRYTHVGFVMVLCFLSFPMATRFRNHIRWWDIAAAAASVAILAYALWGGEDFTDRATSPTRLDVVLGVVFTILLLEATRRTSGWIMPFVGLLFIAYAMAGPHLPPPWTHRGYDLSRLVGHLFITLEGIFGVAVDVSSSLIILFTIYGAFCSIPAPANSSSISRWLSWAASRTVPDARSCCRPFCSAVRQDRAWRPRSPSAPWRTR